MWGLTWSNKEIHRTCEGVVEAHAEAPEYSENKSERQVFWLRDHGRSDCCDGHNVGDGAAQWNVTASEVTVSSADGLVILEQNKKHLNHWNKQL